MEGLHKKSQGGMYEGLVKLFHHQSWQVGVGKEANCFVLDNVGMIEAK